jgi:hypothetical protein
VYPDDPSLAKCAEEAAELIRDSRELVSFNRKQRNSRRGRFGQLTVGVAHGGGRLVSPARLASSSSRSPVRVRALITSRTVKKTPPYSTS